MSVENNMDLEEEMAMLKKEKEESIEAKVKLYNEWWKLKKENEDLTKHDECIEGELKDIENILRCFGSDNKLPSENLECTGCRIRQIAHFVVFMIEGIQKDKFPVVEATPVN